PETAAALPQPARQAAERVERMRLAIARLPDAQRESLELRLRDELSYEEIAEVTGAPVGTVRSRLHHAVRGLREMLEREGAD
ncbi:MAG: sigma-70 family RNA polymerase sigma factor, partial [Phycisphaerae bacterium]|nr:sigma-70 family RNA polymerase sigma factor [Phycisphaerae bacterium]